MNPFRKAVSKIQKVITPKPKMVLAGRTKFYTKYELRLGHEVIGRFEVDIDPKVYDGDSFWGIIVVKIDDISYRGMGYGRYMYQEVLKMLPTDIAGLYSDSYLRHNVVQVPKIYKHLNTVDDKNGVTYIYKQ